MNQGAADQQSPYGFLYAELPANESRAEPHETRDHNARCSIVIGVAHFSLMFLGWCEGQVFTYEKSGRFTDRVCWMLLFVMILAALLATLVGLER